MKTELAGNYNEQGFCHYQNFFEEEELLCIESILNKFHGNWLVENERAYAEGVLNSHSLTSSQYLEPHERVRLFEFIAQKKIVNLLSFEDPKFLNTQLFFDPKNVGQKNYWHRDIQYTSLSVEEQKRAIKTQNVVHVRIPFKKELGIELIPKTHRDWDTKEEFEIRNSLNGKNPSDALERGQLIRLERGDVLLFSANMIHRGLYGNNRFSFDIIFCDNKPEILKFRDNNNLPNGLELSESCFVEVFKQ